MMRLLARAVTILLRAYRWGLSPWLPPACRYVPTCSEYALEAVDHYGLLRGGGMALWRVLRCHPLVEGGFDPVIRIPATSGVPSRLGGTNLFNGQSNDALEGAGRRQLSAAGRALVLLGKRARSGKAKIVCRNRLVTASKRES